MMDVARSYAEAERLSEKIYDPMNAIAKRMHTHTRERERERERLLRIIGF